MTDTLKIVTDFCNAFFEQPPRIMLVIGLVIFGYGWKRSRFDDRYIPFVLPAMGLVLYPLFMCHHLAMLGRCAVTGFLAGCLAVFVNQLYRQLFVSKGEDQGLVTRFLKRKDVTSPPPPAPKPIKPDGFEPPTKP